MHARGLGTDQAAPMAEEGTTNGFYKASNISHTRAAAMNPLLDGIMRAKDGIRRRFCATFRGHTD
jgi:hypothetical protein